MNRTKRSLYTTVLAVGLLAIATAGEAQFKNYGRPGPGFGVKVGGLVGGTELDGDVDFQMRGYLNHGLTEKLTLEGGGGYAAISGGSDFFNSVTNEVIHDDGRVPPKGAESASV